jgi:hypothetical protein
MSRALSDREWSAVLADFRRSGLTQAEFCRIRNISIYTFRYRLYHPRHSRASGADSSTALVPARRTDSARVAAAQFLPVLVRSRRIAPVDRNWSQSPSALELVTGNKQFVRVPVGFDAPTLGRLLNLLEHRS